MGNKITENPKIAGAKKANQEMVRGAAALSTATLGMSLIPFIGPLLVGGLVGPLGLAKTLEGVTPSADDQNMLFDLQFDHILADLSEINKTADDVVQSNIEALGAISASGERIDRLNRDNEHSLGRLVTGSVA